MAHLAKIRETLVNIQMRWQRGNFEETVESGKKGCQSFSKF